MDAPSPPPASTAALAPPGSPRMAALGRFLGADPAIILALVLILVAIAGPRAQRLAVDPGNEALFLENDPSRAALETFRRIFKSDQTIIVALEGDVLTLEGLARLEAARGEIAKLPSVESTLALTSAKNIYMGPIEAYGWPPYEKLRDEDITLEEFKAEVLAEPLFAGNLVSLDGRMAAIVCAVKARDAAAVGAIRDAALRACEGKLTAHIAGTPVERIEFSETIAKDQERFIPLIVGMLVLLLLALFRHVWGVLVPLAVVGATLISTLGLTQLAGKELNAISSMLTPVVMVVSVAVGVNILMAYVQAKEEDASRSRLEASAAALARVGLPCLFTTGTTVAGFASLAAGDVPALQDFGLLCATGVGLSYVFALLIVPPLLALPWRWGPGSLTIRHGRIESILGALAPVIDRRRRLILGISLLAIALAGAGILRIQVETDIVSQLPEGGALRNAIVAIDRSLAGVNAIEVLFEGPPGALRSLEGLRAIESLQRWFAGRDGVAKTISAVDVISRLHEVKRKRRALPDDQETMGIYMGLLDQAKDGPIDAFLSRDGAHARLIARLRALPASRVMETLRAFEAEARRVLPQGIRAVPTGEFVLLQNMTAALPYDMVRGILLATVLIIGSVGLLFRSVRLTLMAAIPASLPIVVVYGLMGWIGIWLSVPTAMISSVVLGLAIDSTILFLSRYQDERRAGLPRAEAVHAMLAHAGQSVSYSNLTLVAGFAISATSQFPPIRDFGLLTSLTIGASYLAALFLLPAMVFSAKAGSLTSTTPATTKE